MNTKTNMTTDKNTKKNERDNEDTRVSESSLPALLAPRYLLPAIIEEDGQTGWSVRRVIAVIAAFIVLAGLVALYIHGGNVAASL